MDSSIPPIRDQRREAVGRSVATEASLRRRDRSSTQETTAARLANQTPSAFFSHFCAMDDSERFISALRSRSTAAFLCWFRSDAAAFMTAILSFHSF